MKNYITTIIAAATSLLLASSCCQLCLKSFSVEPVFNTPKDAKASTSAKATLTFEECKDVARCKAIQSLNKQMDAANELFALGKLSEVNYINIRNQYTRQIQEIAQSPGVKVDGTLPAPSDKKIAASGQKRNTPPVGTLNERIEATAQRIKLMTSQQ